MVDFVSTKSTVSLESPGQSANATSALVTIKMTSSELLLLERAWVCLVAWAALAVVIASIP